MKLDLKAIEQRCEKATPGPWEPWDNYITVEKEIPNGERGKVVAEFFASNPMHGDNCNDTYFVAHARTDIPQLLAFAKDAKTAMNIFLGNKGCNSCNWCAACGSSYAQEKGIASEVLAKHFGDNK